MRQAGDHIPPFDIHDPDQGHISSIDVLEKGPLIVNFYRGLWCSYCQRDLLGVEKIMPDIQKVGATVIAITHGLTGDVRAAFNRTVKTSFPIISDEDGRKFPRWRQEQQAGRRSLGYVLLWHRDSSRKREGLLRATNIWRARSPLPATGWVAAHPAVALRSLEDNLARLWRDAVAFRLVRGPCTLTPMPLPKSPSPSGRRESRRTTTARADLEMANGAIQRGQPFCSRARWIAGPLAADLHWRHRDGAHP